MTISPTHQVSKFGAEIVVVPEIDRDPISPAARHPVLDAWPRMLLRACPFIIIHLLCLGVIWVGWSWTAVGVAAALFVGRMFIITAFYHRFFSHRAFAVKRPVQFIAALAGTASAQRGPIWWAAHHREHHRHSDQPPDIHSPVEHSGLWSHMLWFHSHRGHQINWKAVPDLARFPELVWLERWHLIGPVGLGVLVYVCGEVLRVVAPALGVSGPQLFVWGFGVSTTLLYHATFTINSLAHVIGSRRFNTPDDSRNNFLLAVLTLGEGWHNNHHYYPGAARQGFFWWEIDPTYYALVVLKKLGLITRLNPVPARVYRAAEFHAATRNQSQAATSPPRIDRGWDA